MTFSDNLKRIRKLRGLTQSQLADKIGRKREQLSTYENGSLPSADLLNELALALNVGVGDFFEGPDNVLREPSVPYGAESKRNTSVTKCIIEGPDMSPTLLSGDSVEVRHVNHNVYIQSGKPYMIELEDDTVFRRAYLSEDAKTVTLSADNDTLPDFTVPLEFIVNMYLIKKRCTTYINGRV